MFIHTQAWSTYYGNFRTVLGSFFKKSYGHRYSIKRHIVNIRDAFWSMRNIFTNRYIPISIICKKKFLQPNSAIVKFRMAYLLSMQKLMYLERRMSSTERRLSPWYPFVMGSFSKMSYPFSNFTLLLLWMGILIANLNNIIFGTEGGK